MPRRRRARAGRFRRQIMTGSVVAADPVALPAITLRLAAFDDGGRDGDPLFHVDWTDIQVAGLTPFSAEPITLNGGASVGPHAPADCPLAITRRKCMLCWWTGRCRGRQWISAGRGRRRS